MEIVKVSWQTPIAGNSMVSLHKKLKRLKQVLRDFNKAQFAGLPEKVKEKRNELEVVQISNLSNKSSVEMLDKERVLSKELHEMMIQEESFYRQKSRIQWLNERDLNTRFFHSMASLRKKQNTIMALMDSEGNKLTSYAQISQEAVSYFQKMLGKVDENVSGCTTTFLTELFSDCLSNEANSNMVRPVTPEEVSEAMFSIDGGKAPSLNGYTAHFFKVSWDIVGKEVTTTVLQFFSTNEIILAFNSTIVALVLNVIIQIT